MPIVTKRAGAKPVIEKDLDITCKAYNLMLPNWELSADLQGGTRAMQAAGTRWLPKETDELQPEYQARLEATVLFNGFSRTIKSLAGKPFSKPFQHEGVDEEILDILEEDCDRQGSHVEVFTYHLLENLLADGLRHVLVEYPIVEGKVTQQEAQARNLSPYLVQLDPRNVLFWRFEVVDGEPILNHLRVRETSTEVKDRWNETSVTRIRVYDRLPLVTGGFEVRFQVWRKAEGRGSTWIFEREGIFRNVDRIPLVTFYAGQRGFMEAETPLLDLAYLNIAHWRSDSDQRNILHVARVPILTAAGVSAAIVESGRLPVGARRAVMSTDPNMKVEWVEHTGQAIESGRQDLKDIEERMAVMGLELLFRQTSGPATATEERGDQRAQDSPLVTIIRGVEDGLDRCTAIMARYLGKEPEAGGKTTMHKDFDITTLDAQLILQMRTSRELSRETFFAEMKRRGTLSSAFDAEKEKVLLQGEEQEALARQAEFDLAPEPNEEG